jgi:hypothetical protein
VVSIKADSFTAMMKFNEAFKAATEGVSYSDQNGVNMPSR